MIEEIRKKIDSLDDEIVQLFCRRLDLCKQIGIEKAKNGITVVDLDRENAVLRRLTASLESEKASAVQALYTEIFNITKNLQRNVAAEFDGENQ